MRFDYDEYISSVERGDFVFAADDDRSPFESLCQRIKEAFFTDWEKHESSRTMLDIQKKAIIGYAGEVDFFKNRIDELIAQFKAEAMEYPPWYASLTDAVYHENWGLAGISEWFTEPYRDSSSAKIIGNRIYFMEDGRMVLKPQTLTDSRKEQLIKAFLLLTPEERMDKLYHEVYILDGTRVTIFAEPMAKKGQTSIIFRRYVIPSLTFEAQAQRGTIPRQAIPLFESMVRIGYNVAFLGAVRTAKTTFLSTWQHSEDPTLEGVMVETDPEIPMHELLPDAPILQLIADGEQLSRISKNLLRSDADYFILAEARDGIAMDTAVRIAAKGTKRMKLTFHSRLPKDFPLEAATEIVKATGGDLHITMQKVAKSFDYLFHFIQLRDKREKRLKGIYEMNCSDDGKITVEPICRFDIVHNSWTFINTVGYAQTEYGEESDGQAFSRFKEQLKQLSESSPIYGAAGPCSERADSLSREG